MPWDGVVNQADRERATVRECLVMVDAIVVGFPSEEGELDRAWALRKEAHRLLDVLLASPRWTRRRPQTHALLDAALATPRHLRERVLMTHVDRHEWR